MNITRDVTEDPVVVEAHRAIYDAAKRDSVARGDKFVHVNPRKVPDADDKTEGDAFYVNITRWTTEDGFGGMVSGSPIGGYTYRTTEPAGRWWARRV